MCVCVCDILYIYHINVIAIIMQWHKGVTVHKCIYKQNFMGPK